MNTRIALALALIAIAVLTLGSLFKFPHWPGANAQILFGSLVLVVALVVLAINVARRCALKELTE